MQTKRLEDIDLADIEALKDNGVAESHFLDFKATGVGTSHREFLADVSAFANASGGDIIYGVSESGGVADGVPGFDVLDPDKEELRLRNLLRDGTEPRLTNVGIRWLSIDGTRGVLIVRIPRSWIAPHRVTLQGHDKFYVRDSNGKHPMNVDELRRAFTLADSITERVRYFREDRIRIIQGDDGPLPIQGGIRMILHIVPLAAFVDPPDLQFNHSQHQGIIQPFGAGGFNYQYTLDGYITYSGMENPSEPVRAYALMFRTGIVEMAASFPGGVAPNGRRLLNLTGIESFVAQGWQRYTMFAKFFGIEAPFYVFLTLLNIKGFEPEVSFFLAPSPAPSRRDWIPFPEVEITSDRVNAGHGVIFARLFDTLANAFGLMQSSNTMIPRQ